MAQQRRPRRRKSLRHPQYDYTAAGAYFVTICAHLGHSIFGRIIDQEMVLNPIGQIAHDGWQEIPEHHSYVAIDAFTMMPNHSHGILWLHPDPDTLASIQADIRRDMVHHVPTDDEMSHSRDMVHHVPTPMFNRDLSRPLREFGQPIARSLSTLMGLYKGDVTRTARDAGLYPPDVPLWHGRFWDRIIRNDAELQRIRDYIHNNPARWLEDQLHPKAPPNQFNEHFDRDHHDDDDDNDGVGP